MAVWTVHAAYDPEARAWYTVDSDVAGLSTSGRSIEELRDRASLVIPDLIELNGSEIAPDRRQGPHSLRIVAFHESVVPVAA